MLLWDLGHVKHQPRAWYRQTKKRKLDDLQQQRLQKPIKSSDASTTPQRERRKKNSRSGVNSNDSEGKERDPVGVLALKGPYRSS